MNAIIIGLNTIAAILGYNKLGYYDFDEHDLANIAEIANHEVTNEDGAVTLADVIATYDLYTIEGENRYVCIEFSDSYAIYDKKDDEVDEFAYTVSPYLGYEDLFCIYVEDCNDIRYGIVDDHSIYDLKSDTYLETSKATLLESSEEAGKYYSYSAYGNNYKGISNAFYFDKLNGRHGNNTIGTCGIVGIQMLFGYYDTFENDTIIPESYDIVEPEPVSLLEDFEQSPGTDHDFHNALIDFASERGISDDGAWMTIYQIKDIVTQYLEYRGIGYSCSWVEGNVLDNINNSCTSRIKETINNDRPLLVGGYGHATVAYGYDDDYVYVHTGYGYVARTPWATFSTNLFTNIGSTIALDITEISSDHYHSDNYFSTTLNKYICPCGFTCDSLNVTPEDYGFECQYFFYEKSLDVTVGSHTFNTTRLRTGYIEEEKINLSPRRADAGTAYLVYSFYDAYIRKVFVDLSFWSSSEYMTPNSTDTCLFQYLDSSSNSWVTSVDLLNDVTLGTDRYNQEEYMVEFPDKVKSFRFYSTTIASGSRNKGRLSIGDMEILCYVK